LRLAATALLFLALLLAAIALTTGEPPRASSIGVEAGSPGGAGDTTWIVVGGENLTARVADTPGERYCGYYCYDTPAIVFVWPQGAPSSVTFTMEGLGFPVTLLHIRDCRVVDATVMEPDNKYTVGGVLPGDWFVEVRGRFDTPIGSPVYTPLCAMDG